MLGARASPSASRQSSPSRPEERPSRPTAATPRARSRSGAHRVRSTGCSRDALPVTEGPSRLPHRRVAADGDRGDLDVPLVDAAACPLVGALRSEVAGGEVLREERSPAEQEDRRCEILVRRQDEDAGRLLESEDPTAVLFDVREKLFCGRRGAVVRRGDVLAQCDRLRRWRFVPAYISPTGVTCWRSVSGTFRFSQSAESR